MQSKKELTTLSVKYAQMAGKGGKTAEALISLLVDNNHTPLAKNYDLVTIETEVEKQIHRDLELHMCGLQTCHLILNKCDQYPEIGVCISPLVAHFESCVDFLSSQKEIIEAIGSTIYINNMKTVSIK